MPGIEKSTGKHYRVLFQSDDYVPVRPDSEVFEGSSTMTLHLDGPSPIPADMQVTVPRSCP